MTVEEIERETPTVVTASNLIHRDYQVIVPIANPEHAEQLMRTATDIASGKNGEALVLSIVTLPEQTPLHEGRKYTDEKREVLERAMEFAEGDSVPVSGAIRISHDAGHAVLNTIEQCDSGGFSACRPLTSLVIIVKGIQCG